MVSPVIIQRPFRTKLALMSEISERSCKVCHQPLPSARFSSSFIINSFGLAKRTVFLDRSQLRRDDFDGGESLPNRESFDAVPLAFSTPLVIRSKSRASLRSTLCHVSKHLRKCSGKSTEHASMLDCNYRPNSAAESLRKNWRWRKFSNCESEVRCGAKNAPFRLLVGRSRPDLVYVTSTHNYWSNDRFVETQVNSIRQTILLTFVRSFRQ